jgi:hypothetical protein
MDRFVVWKSSGSSGEPGIYVQDIFALTTYDALLAVQIHAGTLAGPYAQGVLGQGGRAALVAATGDHFASVASWQRLCRGREWPVARVLSVMDPIGKIVDELNAFKPAFLASYPTTLALLATEAAGRAPADCADVRVVGRRMPGPRDGGVDRGCIRERAGQRVWSVGVHEHRPTRAAEDGFT